MKKYVQIYLKQFTYWKKKTHCLNYKRFVKNMAGQLKEIAFVAEIGWDEDDLLDFYTEILLIH